MEMVSSVWSVSVLAAWYAFCAASSAAVPRATAASVLSASAHPADGTAIDLGAMDGMPVIGSTWPTTRVGAGISPWAHTEVHTDADRMNAVPTRPEMSEVRMRFPRELTGIGHAR